MRTLLCLLLLGLWDLALAESCPGKYLRYSKDHSYCREPNKSCKLSGNTVTKDQQEEIVRVHNDLRRKVANGKESTGNLPSASNMLEMQWDEELAEIAKRWAAQCIMDHDCRECRRTNDYKVGQNFGGTGTSSSSPTADFTSRVKNWYSEVKFFDSSMVDKYVDIQGPKTVGHFSQVVWANTWRVGCGYAVYNDGEWTRQIYFCNYGPGGNLDAPVYKRGRPCSQCPKNTECNDGLCRVKKDSVPVYEPPAGNYLYYCDFSDIKACNIKQPAGKKQWTITKTFAGGHVGIVLKKGEESEFSIGTTLKATSNSCFTFNYRKGPNVAGEESGNEATFGLTTAGKTWRSVLKKDSDDMEFGFTDSSPYPYELSFGFKALKGTQYFEITRISVRDC